MEIVEDKAGQPFSDKERELVLSLAARIGDCCNYFIGKQQGKIGVNSTSNCVSLALQVILVNFISGAVKEGQAEVCLDEWYRDAKRSLALSISSRLKESEGPTSVN